MRKCALFILFLYSVVSIAQNCNSTLSGTVTDLHDGSLLIGTTITVVTAEKTVETDIDGKFTIPNLCDDTYFIQVSHPFCMTKGFSVKVSGNTTKFLKLEHHLEELNEIIVKGNSYHSKSKTMHETKITNEELERFSSGSIGDALNTLSGVSSLNTGNAVIKPLVNGLHSSRVVLINDGVRVEDQEWGAEHAPNIDINSIANLTLIKGAGALQYSGDAVGGLIIAEAAKIPVKDSIYGKTLLTAASNGRGGAVTTQLTKAFQSGWYTSAQATLKRFGDFEAPDYILSNTGVSSYNGALRVGYNHFDYGVEASYSIFKNKIGILRASHIGGASDLVRAINSDRPLIIKDFTYNINIPRQEVIHHIARLKGFKRFDNFGKLSLQYDFQRNNRLEFDIRRGADKGKASLDLQLDTHTLLLDLDSNLNDDIKLKTGVAFKYHDNFAPNTGVRRLIPNYEKYDLGVYGIIEYPLNDQWLFELGGRFDYAYMDTFKYYRSSFWEQRGYDVIFADIVIDVDVPNKVLARPQFHYYNPSATFGVTHSFGKNYKLFFNYSMASRAPNPSELFSEGLHHSASRIELGDLRFKSEIGHKVALTLDKEADKFSYSVSPFVNSISNFIVIEPVEVRTTTRGSFQVWEYRQTNAQLLGVDVDASYALTQNWSLNSQLSIVKGYDRIKAQPLINMPPVNTTNEVVYQNADFNNLRLSLQSVYNFRQNEYPDNNFDAFIPETQTRETVDVSTPPGAYHLLNFNSSMDFNVNKTTVVSVGFGVTNILDTAYRNYLNRQRYYADDLGRNFLINLKINF